MREEKTNKELLTLSVELSLKAGREIMEVYQNHQEMEVELKTDNTPVTEADKRAHNTIVESLMGTNIPIISEEGDLPSYKERRDWHRFWLIDPLDGTKEFIKRNGDFTVNIALIEEGKPLLGVVYTPVHKTVYFAEVGFGSWRTTEITVDTFCQELLWENAESLPVKQEHSPYTVLLSRSHMTEETYQWVEEKKNEEPSLTTKHAGSSLKSCIIAEGNAHIHPRLGNTMEWDTGAAHAVVLAAGKDIVNFHTGESLQYNTNNFVNPWFIVQ